VDQVGVNPAAVVGRVAYSIPKVGYLIDFAQRPEGRLVLIAIPGLLLAIDYLLSTRRRHRATVQPARSESEELVVRGRMAMNNGALGAAISLFDQAIALNPRLEEAWLMKSECLDPTAGLACLQAGLTVNPGSAMLRSALDGSTAAAGRGRS
jgi:hypothetical protein